mmetsp:Transcript_36488/g.75946  ORF Transcript_36488/g.75946 Transcript_36488/m.75946 type:complete len:213 (-) Transcript_36488:754-1392(-)
MSCDGILLFVHYSHTCHVHGSTFLAIDVAAQIPSETHKVHGPYDHQDADDVPGYCNAHHHNIPRSVVAHNTVDPHDKHRLCYGSGISPSHDLGFGRIDGDHAHTVHLHRSLALDNADLSQNFFARSCFVSWPVAQGLLPVLFLRALRCFHSSFSLLLVSIVPRPQPSFAVPEEPTFPASYRRFGMMELCLVPFDNHGHFSWRALKTIQPPHL